uniref:hypothetical protein n=1 Tax=Okeania sp. SIO2F4 TaxID=2607790 RepID=UPI0025CB8F2D
RKKVLLVAENQILLVTSVANFGYDLYLLAIAKLLNNKYLRLFSFYFHTLTQQRLAIKSL